MRSLCPLAALVALGGCSWLGELGDPGTEPSLPPAGGVRAVEPPVASHRFVLTEAVGVVGELQVIEAGAEDTLSDIARRFDLGYEELLLANPGVDPWLPGAGTSIVLPTAHVLPDAPQTGLVINLAAMRLFYYPPAGPDGRREVLTHPIGIGRLGWSTPTGETRVTGKARDPVWYVPASVRREHAEAGDPLPAMVPPGLENPLGAHVFTLALPGYLIHGTNKPAGVGMRVSHGCMRLYPEDMAALYERVAIDTPVTLVNQPYSAGWRDGRLYVEAHGLLEDDERAWHQALLPTIDRALAAAPRREGARETRIDWQKLGGLARNPRGLPVPVERDSPALDALLVAATRVSNALPAGSNWDGRIEYRMPQAELEALLEDRPATQPLVEDPG